MHDQENEQNCDTLTFFQKLTYVRKHITVEPILACYVTGCMLANLATQNLYLEKACRVNLGHSTETCDALTRRDIANYTSEDKKVQQLVAAMTGWKSILQSALPSIMILFYGSWSDRHGRRKPCILIPIIGELTTVLGLILCTYFHNTRMEVAGVTDALFPGLTGGWFTMLMGVFSYISDVTTKEDRTIRIGIANLCFSLGIPIGMALSGVLIKLVGFYGIFSISATLYVIALVYGFVCIREPDVVRKHRALSSCKVSKKSAIAEFFDLKHVAETFKVAFKSGSNQRRLRIIMLMVVVMVIIGPIYGEMAVSYLFTRHKFHWSEVEFSIFSTYGMVTGLAGCALALGVFSRKLKIDDALIGVMSSISKISSSFVYCFAVTEWQLCLAPLVDCFSGTSFTAVRSIVTKLVDTDELGKVNSLIGAAEALMPLVYSPIYSFLYAATINTFPGAFYLVGGALILPTTIIFLWLYKMNQIDLKTKANASKIIVSTCKKQLSENSIEEMESLNP